MKNFYLIAFLFITTIAHTQIVTIPDNNFKFNLIIGDNVDNDGDGNYTEDVDTNGDGEIQVSEAEAVISLLIHSTVSFPINTIEGIESFTNLEDFESDNDIANADFSQNLSLIEIDVSFNAMENLILPPSPNLIEVLVQSSNLTSIDVSQNPNLEFLNVRAGNISSLDVSQNPNLLDLRTIQNPLTSIDVTQNPNLIQLSVSYCNITSLDVTQNPNLEWLSISDNPISEIDLSQNPNLSLFAGIYTPLQSLDFTQNPMMTTIHAHHTQLSSLNIKNGHNTSLNNLLVRDNLALNCITVDDVSYANAQSCSKTGAWGWCRDNGTIYNEDCATAGLEDYNIKVFKMYPNPVQNVLNIETEEEIEGIEIYSPQGQLIKEGHSPSIDISALSSGLYLVRVIIAGNAHTQKLIKF